MVYAIGMTFVLTLLLAVCFAEDSVLDTECNFTIKNYRLWVKLPIH